MNPITKSIEVLSRVNKLIESGNVKWKAMPTLPKETHGGMKSYSGEAEGVRFLVVELAGDPNRYGGTVAIAKDGLVMKLPDDIAKRIFDSVKV